MAIIKGPSGPPEECCASLTLLKTTLLGELMSRKARYVVRGPQSVGERGGRSMGWMMISDNSSRSSPTTMGRSAKKMVETDGIIAFPLFGASNSLLTIPSAVCSFRATLSSDISSACQTRL